MLHESLSTAVDVRHELDPVFVRLEIKGGAFAPGSVVAQPVIVLQNVQMNPKLTKFNLVPCFEDNG